MASEWVKLTLQDGGKTIHVNLANVSSIECDEKGSVIWFLAGVGEDGKARNFGDRRGNPQATQQGPNCLEALEASAALPFVTSAAQAAQHGS
jgi:hypothetical protein